MSSSNQQAKPAPSHGGYPSVGGGQPVPAPTTYSFTLSGAGIGSTISNPIQMDSGKVEVKIANPRPIGTEVMRIGHMVAGRFDVSFCEYEGSEWVKATFDPDPSMSPLESLRISMLITATMGMAAAGADLSDVKPITYLRAHGLERHFRFSTV